MLLLAHMIKQKKIFLALFFLILTLLVSYVIWANSYVYYRIGQGNIGLPKTNTVSILNNMNKKSLNYVVLGDSLSAGAGVDFIEDTLPYLLAEKIYSKQNVNIENLAIPGYQTKDINDELLDKLISHKPDLVTIFIGVNDVHNKVTQEQFSENYQKIIDKVKESTDAEIYLINIPMIGSKTLVFSPVYEYLSSRTIKFNKIILKIAQDNNLKYIDLYTPTKEKLRLDGDHYSNDSFHPSASGYLWWANLIYDQLND